MKTDLTILNIVDDFEDYTNDNVDDPVNESCISSAVMFPYVTRKVALQDNRHADTYSKKSSDIDSCVQVDGSVPISSTGKMFYYGYWAYPRFIDCRLFDELTIISRTDEKEVLIAKCPGSNDDVTITVYSGTYIYDQRVRDAEKSIVYADLLAGSQSTNVYSIEPTKEQKNHVRKFKRLYVYKLGNFTVEIKWTGKLLFERDLQTILSSIQLRN